MLRYLAENPAVGTGPAEYALDDQTVTPHELAILAGVAYRGPIRRDYKTVLDRIRRMLGDEGHG
jgi:hypothetical protein